MKDYHVTAIDHCHKSYMESIIRICSRWLFYRSGRRRADLQMSSLTTNGRFPFYFWELMNRKMACWKSSGLVQEDLADPKIRQEFYDLGMALLEVMLAGKESANGERVEIPMEEAPGGHCDQEKIAGAYGTRGFCGSYELSLPDR